MFWSSTWIAITCISFVLAYQTLAAANSSDYPDVVPVLFLPVYWLLFVIGIFAAVGSLLGHTIVSIFMGFVVAVVFGIGLFAVALFFGL